MHQLRTKDDVRLKVGEKDRKKVRSQQNVNLFEIGCIPFSITF